MSKPDLTTYGGLLRDIGYAGQLMHEFDTNDIDSKINEGATSIDFGIAVARGTTSDETCKAIAVDGDAPIGITVRLANRPADASGNVTYAQRDSVAILKTGWIVVVPFENVGRGTQALSITAQGGKIGSTTGGAAGAGRVVIPGAVWETTTTAGQPGIVRIVY